MVTDNYQPNIRDTNWMDKMSDQLLGTNRVQNTNMTNNYELQKAINVNKYEWNKEGMLQAGINPLIASGNLSNVAASQAQSTQSQNTGFFGNELVNLLKEFSPSQQVKDLKELGRMFAGKKF